MNHAVHDQNLTQRCFVNSSNSVCGKSLWNLIFHKPKKFVDFFFYFPQSEKFHKLVCGEKKKCLHNLQNMSKITTLWNFARTLWKSRPRPIDRLLPGPSDHTEKTEISCSCMCTCECHHLRPHFVGFFSTNYFVEFAKRLGKQIPQTFSTN